LFGRDRTRFDAPRTAQGLQFRQVFPNFLPATPKAILTGPAAGLDRAGAGP